MTNHAPLGEAGARLRALVAQLEETAAHYEEQADDAMFARRLQRAGRAAAGKPELPDDECEAVTIRLACDSLLNINEVATLVQLLRDAKAELDALLAAPVVSPPQEEEMETIKLPWVYLSLGDHAPNGQRPIYYQGHGSSEAVTIGYVDVRTFCIGKGHSHSAVAIISAACEAYNRERNAKEAVAPVVTQEGE